MELENSSVGRALSRHQITTFNHPSYLMFAEAVTDELNTIVERETERRASARPLLLTSALSSDELSSLAGLYPEFAVAVVPLSKSVHSYWRALREAANEWSEKLTSRYATKVVHFGGSLMSSLMRSHASVHLEFDPADEVMAHERLQDLSAVARVYADYATVQTEQGLVLPRLEYDKFLARRAYSVCSDPKRCVHKAEAMCVDLSIVEMSPAQVAVAMLQHGASLCHGFFIYEPSMLVQDSGLLGMSGVTFERSDDTIYFRYPEGNAGVRSYSRQVWSRWLASHTFRVGDGDDWFQLELLKNRDAFMFFRLAKVAAPAGVTVVTHALDLPRNDEHVVVSSWRLKQGLRSDPAQAESWERYSFLVRERITSRVYEFAMQLKPTEFSRYAIKKQIRVVNNRWVVAGTTVVVTPSLEPQQVEDLSTAIYSRAFVDRYESAALSGEMMSALKSMMSFHSLSNAQRCLVVARAVYQGLLRATVGKVIDSLGGFLDRLREACGRSVPRAGSVEFLCAPTYVTMSSAVGTWRAAFSRYGEAYYRDSDLSSAIMGSGAGMATLLSDVVKRMSVRAMRSSRRMVHDDGHSPGDLSSVVRVCTDVVDTRLSDEERSESADGFVQAVAAINPIGSTNEARHHMTFEMAERAGRESVQDFRYAPDPDPVSSLNSLYSDLFPAVAGQRMEYDTFSLSLDPQDRTLAAPYLRMPKYFGLPPNPRSYYPSKVKALNVPKRQNTAQELLSAVVGRNLSAPAVSLPQEQDQVIRLVWENFLDRACVADAREKLLEYQSDPVALSEDGLRDWAAKAKPEVLERVKRELVDQSKALEQMKTGEYLAMLKADVKPTLSNKPVNELTAPQVIVYHEKAMSSLYSSIFRVLVRRFLSLLKHNYHVNLLKDSEDISNFVTSVHDFAREGLSYLENDFSKYDKSQSEFAFAQEQYVFEQLGMNHEMLARWLEGHVECSIRSVSVGLSLDVMYQRKSGDATTAFGNVILNILSVTYAYAGSEVLWAVFMGDDSLACVGHVACAVDAVRMMAELFNLTAKYYITKSPYFASNFVVIDRGRLEANLIPDPVKRIERMSMHVSAEDPQWGERFASYKDSLKGYLNPATAGYLSVLVPQRYEVSEGFVRGAASALGTVAKEMMAFRSLWEEEPSVLQA